MNVASLLLAFFLCPPVLAAQETVDCSIDKKALLALDEQHFDQDMDGGWRKVAHTHGCELVAADAVRDYRTTRHIESSVLLWHEGQLRASAGEYERAIPLLEQARNSSYPDVAWNYYVDATVAFLRRDRVALDRAHERMSVMKPTPDIEVNDGYIELHMRDGSTRKTRWPENIDVVESLQRCFDKSYFEAYGHCRGLSR